MWWISTIFNLNISDKNLHFSTIFVILMGSPMVTPFCFKGSVDDMKRSFRIESLDPIAYHEMEPGFLFPGESLAAAKLTYVDQGQIHSVADGTDLLLQRGDLVLYAPGQWHMQYADMTEAPRFVTMTFHAPNADFSPLINQKFSLPQNLTALLQQILREQDRMDDLSPDIILASVELLLLQLLRRRSAPVQGLKTSYALHSENEIIRRAQQYVSAHIRDKLTVPLVARKVDVSPSYLTALFHKHLEISPGEYIRRVKLQESKHLIREGKLNFTEIAAALNYSTVHHFSRQFKEKFGITPTDYAKSIK